MEEPKMSYYQKIVILYYKNKSLTMKIIKISEKHTMKIIKIRY